LAGVYVITNPDRSVVKIGMSRTDLRVRIETHSRDLANEIDERLELARIIPTTSRAAPFLERVMHWIYEGGRRGAKEIFDGCVPDPASLRTAEDVLELSRAICRQSHQGTI